MGAFFDGLRALGYVEGQNILIERRFAAGKSERVPAFATELVQLGVNLIVATGNRENQAAHQATTTIPVIMIVVPDPVGMGLVASLARPGGNITGLTFGASGLAEKYVELLREAVPSATRMAVVVSRQQPAALLEELQGAARALKVALFTPTLVRGPEEYEPIFARAKRDGVGGLIFPIDALTVLHRQLIVDLVAKYRLPAIYTLREHVEAGGLMAYGASFPDLFRRAATFADRILKGARPADLPVEQPTRFELVLNRASRES